MRIHASKDHQNDTDIDILFICLGNICRSPLAEGIMRHLCTQHNVSLRVASAGTGRWHVGEAPHRGSQAIAKQFEIDISHQKSQHTSEFDLQSIPYLCVMDHQNYKDVLHTYPYLDQHTPSVLMMRFFEDKDIYTQVDWSNTSLPRDIKQLISYQAVPDPYYGNGRSAFAEVYNILLSSCQGLLSYITWHQAIQKKY